MRTFGVDVSHWEGYIDWKTAARWIPFVYYKATDGIGHVDNTFTYNRDQCNLLGIPHAPYHYYQTERDPVAQANWFIETVGTQYKRYILDLEDPPASSLQATPNLENPSAILHQIAPDIRAFLQRCEQLTGIKPAIYTSPGYWNEFVKPKPTWCRNYDLLVAHYTIAHTPAIPIGWDAYTIWQFSENYYFPGCISAADGDWFNGDLGQVRAWFGNHRQVDPPFYSHTRLRSLFNGLHVRRSPDVKSREVDHLNKGDQVELENLGEKDVWVRHSKGWSCIEKDDYRYMEIVKDE